MKKKFTIVVPGAAVAKPRMTRRDKWAKRDNVMRYRAWADHVRLIAHAAGGVPEAERILDVSWVARFEPPASTSKKKRAVMIGTLHRNKPDRDNIDKAVLDVLFKEDQGIASGTIRKEWADQASLTIVITYE